MRATNTLSTVGTTVLELGEGQFIGAGHELIIAGADSVATATLRVTMNDAMIFNGPLGIEAATDHISYHDDFLTQAPVPPSGGNIIATLGGTVAGARVNFLDLAPEEWGGVAAFGPMALLMTIQRLRAQGVRI